MKRILLLLALSMAFSSFAFGEKIKGKVLSKRGVSTSGLVVSTKDKKKYTIVDSQGDYHLELSPGKHELDILFKNRVIHSLQIEVAPKQQTHRDIQVH